MRRVEELCTFACKILACTVAVLFVRLCVLCLVAVVCFSFCSFLISDHDYFLLLLLLFCSCLINVFRSLFGVPIFGCLICGDGFARATAFFVVLLPLLACAFFSVNLFLIYNCFLALVVFF